jgi:hypothetical protein
MGFFALKLGPLALVEALIILAIVGFRIRRFPEQTGAYLLGASLVPVIVLASTVARMPACQAGVSSHGECYAPITGPMVIAGVILGLIGAAILAVGLRPMLSSRV